MARSYEGLSNSKTRRQEEDARRMAFRRAIESRIEERRLLVAILDYPDLHSWPTDVMGIGQSVQPGH